MKFTGSRHTAHFAPIFIPLLFAASCVFFSRPSFVPPFVAFLLFFCFVSDIHSLSFLCVDVCLSLFHRHYCL